ncbi:MAG TPA: nitroreductase/quinone reductase family protein [Jiangellaceae bacterium]|nr:nitroreductase/quinone reductase family protein [Jiangellaceae bacterium]
MNAAVKRLIKAGNRLAVFLYRRSSGRIGGTARSGTLVLLLTLPGRKTGTPHTTPVSYFEAEGG